MGEKTNLSPVNIPAEDSKDSAEPFNKESAIAELSSVSISSGFYFTAFTLISFLATAIIAFIFYYSITDIIRISEISFKRYATDLLNTSLDNVQTAAKTNKFAGLSQLIKNLVDSQGIDEENKMINEIFFLDKKGRVLAHTDLTKVTNSANSTINRISSIYNNDLFHTGLMLPPGEINIQPYPYQTFNRNRSYLYLIKFMLPRDYFDTMDFSIPVYSGRYAIGTFHLVMNRVYTDILLQRIIGMWFIIWMASLLIAAFLAFIIKLPVLSKVKKINLVVQNYLAKDVDQYIEKTEKLKIREEMEYIDRKIAETVRSGQNLSASAKNTINVKDAYLLREN